MAFVGASVPGPGSQAYEGGELLSAEVAQFGKEGDQGGGGEFAYAGDALVEVCGIGEMGVLLEGLAVFLV